MESIRQSLGNASWWLVVSIAMGLAVVLAVVVGLGSISHGAQIAGSIGGIFGALGATALEAQGAQGGVMRGFGAAVKSPWWYLEILLFAGLGVALSLPLAFLGAIVCAAAGAFLGALGGSFAESKRVA